MNGGIERGGWREREERKGVSKLVFYAQSTSAVISGRKRKGRRERARVEDEERSRSRGGRERGAEGGGGGAERGKREE